MPLSYFWGSALPSSCLSLHNLHCERDERVLFTGLSVGFGAGSVVQVAGPNGAGKTTLLKILTGLSSGFDGEVRWCGKAISTWGTYNFYSSLLYIGHSPGIKSSLTAKENLRWYFGLNGAKSADGQAVSEEALAAALEQVDLGGYEDVPCQQMSAGQQRRVGLARLYCSRAQLWILDEPFTAIDKKGVEAVEGLISTHADAGGLVILTTHQPLALGGVVKLDLGEYTGRER